MRVFRRRSSSPPASSRNGYSIIAAGTTVLGDVETGGTLRIEGAIAGSSVRADVIVLSASGTITGDVHAREAVIAGRVEGEMVTTDRLELQSSAVIDGSVATPVLVVHDGAAVRGNVRAGSAATEEGRNVEKGRASTPRLVAAAGGDGR